ncbi:MAG: CASTOR/POLLUX-related putative ion channel [Pseudomonadota bacterium]
MFRIRLIDRVKFLVERQFVRGAAFQLLVVMLFIGLISVVGGVLVAPADDQFDDLGGAIWWAFLRLTDPGYLGDDEGSWTRFISTLLTVSGYVVFLGALVAIMTRKLIAVMQDLERGLTPVYLKNHVVVLGWNNRTRPLLRELLGSTARMRRFLEKHDARRLQLVVLSEEASAGQRLELGTDPGIGRRARQIILRSGTPIQPEALNRVACLEAAVVIIPGDSHGVDSLVTQDMEVVKALLSITHQARERQVPLPYAVVELQDIRQRRVVERAYPGELEVVAGDAVVGRLLVQNMLHPGLSSVYNELLTDRDGNEIYVRSGEVMEGRTLEALAVELPAAIVLGLLRPEGGDAYRAQLVTDSDEVISAEDRVVILARHYDETGPGASRESALAPLTRPVPAPADVSTVESRNRPHRLLVLGWSRRVPTLIAELASYRAHDFSVDLLSTVSMSERKSRVRDMVGEDAGVDVRFIEADFMAEGVLRRLGLHDYDTILLVSSDRVATGEEADARSMVGHLLLDDILQESERRPQVLLELSDPANESLLTLPDSEVLVSPIILSHILAQVALRRELGAVFEELFTVGGAEFLFHDPSRFVLPDTPDFRALEEAAAARGEIALGIYRRVPDASGNRLLLNPPRTTMLALERGDQVVVLADSGHP